MPQVNDFSWLYGSLMFFLLTTIYWFKVFTIFNFNISLISLKIPKFSFFSLV